MRTSVCSCIKREYVGDWIRADACMCVVGVRMSE